MQEDFENYSKKYLGNVGSNIRKYRLLAKLTQEKFAEKVDLSREYINRIENKKENVSMDLLLKSSFYLNVTPMQLLEPTSENI